MSQPHSRPVERGASEGVLRVLFGSFMAITSIAILLYSAEWFAGLVVLLVLFAAREWHRMVRSPAMREAAEQRPVHVQTILSGVTIALAVLLMLEDMALYAFGAVIAGAAASFAYARVRNDNPSWHAAGVLYIGVPALALVALRGAPSGALIVLFGKLIGGPRITPKLSPGKTWAGTIGGSLSGALVFAFFIAVLGFDVTLGALYAFFFSFVAHAGDLLESMVKRRFGTKDSGGMIPGHGGVLDRLDSTFAAAIVLAVLVFGAGFNPLFGGQS
jgi:phosphatidate cytidylyltransferase